MAVFTKIAIVKAFAELASAKPIDKITVTDITSRCHISRNTFYYHFKDIYDVLEAMLDLKKELIIREIEENAGSMDIEEFCMNELNAIISHRDLFYHIYQSAKRQEVKQYVDKACMAIFERLVDILSEGIPAKEKDKRFICRFFRYALSGFMIEWLEGDTQESLEEIINTVKLLFMGGIEEALRRSVTNS